MKGLLCKDWAILVNSYKKNFLIMVVLYLGMAVCLHMNYLCYALVAVCGVYASSTMNFDDYAHWDTYARTLPVTPGQVVGCKYLLGLLFTLFGSVCAAVGIFLAGQYTDVLEAAFSILLIAAFSLLLFAVNMPISKYLLPAHVPPEGLTIMRMAFACVMFWIVSLFTVKEKVPLKDLGMLFVCALCGVGINQGLFIVGLNRSSPVDASIIATAVPIFVLLLAAVILKEPITRKKSFGVFMGVSGGLLLVFSSTHAIDSISSLDGDMMMIVSGLMYAIYLVLSKPLSLRYSSVTMMKWMFLFTTLTLVPFTFRHVLDAPAFHREVWDFTELGAIFYVLFGATFLPYLLIPMSLKRIRPTTVSMYNYVQPIVASFIAVMIGQDTLSWQKVLSAVLVFTGVYLVTQSKSREDMEKGKR